MKLHGGALIPDSAHRASICWLRVNAYRISYHQSSALEPCSNQHHCRLPGPD